MKLDALLRCETQVQHQRLHQVVDLTRMTETPQLYTAALQAYLQAVGPLEIALEEKAASIPPASLPSELPERLQKRHWIRRDLDHLGAKAIFDTPLRSSLHNFFQTTQSPLAVIAGCGYVMEGMTLGAVRIARLVQEKLGFDEQSGARFFHSYGPRTGPMWQDYRQWLAEADVDGQVSVRAAQLTFAHFEDVLSDWHLASEGPSVYA